MMGRTHALLGITSLWLVAPVPGVLTPATIAPLAALAAFGALLPDLDADASTVRSIRLGGVRPFAPIGMVINRAWGHRGLLHSPVGLLLFSGAAFLLALAWLPLPALALWMGYASHLAGDACTKSGIPGWPNRADRRFYALPARLRLVTGSWAEERLLPF